MAGNQTPGDGGTADSGFRISAGPVIRQGMSDIQLPSELLELQRAGGPPILFAIPRDPQTIFAYWNVDWDAAFAKGAPLDRQVFLRVRKDDGTEESEAVVEPMMGSHYADVAGTGGRYFTELGFYDAANGWLAVATSEVVEMPRDSVSENAELDLATVPFHLSFQRMIDMFRASNGNSLGAILSRLQARAARDGSTGDLTNEEDELLRAMKVSAADMQAASKSFEDEDDTLRRKAEAVLGFGATSPSKGFGESSRGAAPSSPSR
jgi:uncharacterized protein DUF4912